MLTNPPRRRLAPALLTACLVGVGCTPNGTDTAPQEAPGAAALVTVEGVVTLNGRPLPTAVVTFLPPNWAPGLGETDEEGAFTLTNAGRPGTVPGRYKVAISLLLSADGEPQGLEPRSSLVPPKAMLTAKEAMPPSIADLSRTTLSVEVGPGGGSFRFDLKADVAWPKPGSGPDSEPGPRSKAEAEPKPSSPAAAP